MLSAGGIREDFAEDENTMGAFKDQTSSIQQATHTDAKKKKKEQIKGAR